MNLGTDLITLGILLVVAYVLGRAAKLIGLPSIPIYMIVGLLASPYTHWFPIDFHSADIELIAVFGLILLLFSLGLEFDQEEFFNDAGKLLLSGGSYVVINMGIGFAFGMMVGWGTREALVIAGMTGTSSSAIITKLLIELRRLANKETPMILGVTVVGDIFIAVYLSIVSVVLSGKTEIWPIVLQLSIAFLFLVVMFSLARWGGRVVSRLVRTKDDELFTILFFGLAVLFAGIGEIIGVTDAIGAFLIGVVLGASTYRTRLERVAVPLRDIFAAFFFLNFGLALHIAEFGSVILVVLAAVVMTFVLNLISGMLLARLHSMGISEGLNAAAILVNRGEFTLILATLSVGAGLNGLLQPFAGLYVLTMAILGPLFAANSERLGALLPGRRRKRAGIRPDRDPMYAEEFRLVDAATAGALSDQDAQRAAAHLGDQPLPTSRPEPRKRMDHDRRADHDERAEQAERGEYVKHVVDDGIDELDGPTPLPASVRSNTAPRPSARVNPEADDETQAHVPVDAHVPADSHSSADPESDLDSGVYSDQAADADADAGTAADADADADAVTGADADPMADYAKRLSRTRAQRDKPAPDAGTGDYQ
ncbi:MULTISPECIES: cation:proton antiporter [unclassified Cryobacterium]|uniref:cation:proton antiporter n=1 Tax=unclassified Cryobacterium TaxID=2649013 RepID=UPI002AB424EB|nr:MULTISPECIES: cation:proton antiporter [unclassified Cryobacterium]MDY7541474.1 cation:proton antiporter [Cryobacterium sp. 5B3]MEA9999574.1 cation:proton antiporter [Cryobacterium sp. RTS3]MEB0274817.1 cation:proton antiporter [Cryobacterium sp. 5B3]